MVTVKVSKRWIIFSGYTNDSKSQEINNICITICNLINTLSMYYGNNECNKIWKFGKHDFPHEIKFVLNVVNQLILKYPMHIQIIYE